MTPFGERLRKLRAERGVTLSEMAAAIGVSAAYLSALEHGHRGRPSWRLVQRIIAYFNIIWDDAEELAELARLSHPRVVIDTSGLSPQATRLANVLARRIRHLDEARIQRLLAILEETDKSTDEPASSSLPAQAGK
jgi:transcriptional regulator with XRE-family HTH domain